MGAVTAASRAGRESHQMVDIALRLDGVSRYYGDVRAVDNLSLNIPSGAFVTLLGPSGCGKSTTLSLIAGLDRLDEGRILLGDEDITDTPPNERRMAMVFQNYALYPHMTAYDNIAFGLKLQHRPKDEIKQRVGGGRGGARHHPPAEAQAGPDVRRPAAARRAGARPRQGADGLPPRRAVQQPRRRPAQPDADGGQAPPPEAGHDERVRDPRPGGGDEPVRPHRGDARRQGRPARARPGRSTGTRATSTSPRSSASPR